MKITPSKDYKKPLYAIGIAAAIAAAGLTGCSDPAATETTETEVGPMGETQGYCDPQPTDRIVSSITAGIVTITLPDQLS
jgi:hypothetical protein